MKRQRYRQMNPLSDMLPLLEVFTGLDLKLLEVYLRGTIHLDFSHHCSAPFFSASFMMHDTNNHAPSLTVGSIHGRMRVCETEGSAGAEAVSTCQKVHHPSPHTSAVDRSPGPPAATSQPNRKSIFLGVHSCHLTFWGTAGGSQRRQERKPS